MVNFCISSGVSVIAIFVSFLCAILASAFYKYSTHHQQMSYNDIPNILNNKCEDDELDKSTTEIPDASLTTPLLSMTSVDVTTNGNTSPSATVSEIEINIDENINENGHENGQQENDQQENDHEQISDDILIDTIEGSEEEIQKQQIANIYRLLNDQHLINNWTTTDFLDQLKMYGLHGYDEDETESPSSP